MHNAYDKANTLMKLLVLLKSILYMTAKCLTNHILLF